MSFSAISDGIANGQGGCFEVNYSAQEINASNLSSTTKYWEGASSTIILSKASSCKIYTEANIYVNTNQSSTAPIDTVPALRYKLFMESNQISEGLITQKGDTLVATVPLTDSTVNYTLYVWIDSSLSGGNYDNTSYSGQIFAESSQTSTVDKNYLLTFNDNNDLNINLNKTVTIGENYGWLPKLEKEGYDFKGWSLLPDEYQQVEYIESNGNQYIMTDIIPNDNTGVYAKLISKNTSSDLVYFGTRATGSERFGVGNSSNTMYFGWNAYTTASLRPSVNSTSINIINLNYLNNRKHILNGNIIQSDIGTLGNITYNLPIFGFNSSGTVTYKSSIKLYEFKISNKVSITNDFIPCLNTNDNKYGLYDRINNRFYGNNGTGTDFEHGNNVYITSSTNILYSSNHTLTAIWE